MKLMGILCVGDLSNVPMIFHNKFSMLKPMLLQMQGFSKDMNAICKVLNIGRPVLQIMTVLSFVSRVLKNDMKVLLLVQKWL